MHLSEVIRQHSYELLTRQEVVRLTENLKKTAPELVEEAIPQMISYSYFQRVLTNLLKEGIPIRDLETIVENLLSDLSDECLANLPLRHKAESYGSARIGRVAAYALRARIALNWKKYDLAASSAKQALNLAKEAGFELESINTQYCGESHEAGEPTGQTALFGYDGEASNEWLWSVQYDAVISSNKTKEAYYMAPRTLGGCAYFGPTQTFVDMFQSQGWQIDLRNLLCMTGRTLGKTGTLVWIFSVCDLVHAYSI